MDIRNIIPLLVCLICDSGLASASERLEYVNARPQFNVTDEFFALYIGIWRGFDAAEVAMIDSNAVLLAKRDIRWRVQDCSTSHISHTDLETLWTIDELTLDPAGAVRPISEAVRPGYRYFSLANLHGLYLRGTGDFRRPPRNPGEPADEYRARVAEARAAWWRSASPKGTKGEVFFALSMRLVPGVELESVQEQFIRFENYREIGDRDPEMAELFRRTAPNRWPVNYDERAHKPHAFHEPRVWQSTASADVRTDEVKAKLVWDWCDPASPLAAHIVVPELIAPGPNRAGRTDHGPATIEVVLGPVD